MSPRIKYGLVSFLIGGVIGLLLFNTTASFVHGLILYISPSPGFYLFNAFWSYGLLAIVLTSIMRSRWKLLIKILALILILGCFFLLNRYSTSNYVGSILDQIQSKMAEG